MKKQGPSRLQILSAPYALDARNRTAPEADPTVPVWTRLDLVARSEAARSELSVEPAVRAESRTSPKATAATKQTEPAQPVLTELNPVGPFEADGRTDGPAAVDPRPAAPTPASAEPKPAAPPAPKAAAPVPPWLEEKALLQAPPERVRTTARALPAVGSTPGLKNAAPVATTPQAATSAPVTRQAPPQTTQPTTRSQAAPAAARTPPPQTAPRQAAHPAPQQAAHRPPAAARPSAPPPAPPRTAPIRPKRKRSFARRLFRGIVFTLLALFAITVIASGTAYWYGKRELKRIEATLPAVSDMLANALPTTSYIYAADGTELGRFADEHRIWVDLDAISPYAVEALVATEDRLYYEHEGVDYKRLASAAYKSFRGSEQGASTLTMQLVRNLYPDIARLNKFDRKIREVLMAGRLETTYSKDQILELYLNTMSFGHGAFGIEAAAQVFYRTTAKALTPIQAATLIGLLKGPSYYDPAHAPDRTIERRNVVLASMRDTGRITPGAYERLSGDPLGLNIERSFNRPSAAPHFTDYVRRWVDHWGRENGYDLYRDGLHVFTTIDLSLQAVAQASVERQLNRLQKIAGDEWRSASGKATSGPAPFSYFWRTNRSFESDLIRQSATYRRFVNRGMAEDGAELTLRADPWFMDSLRSSATRLEAGLVAIDPLSGAVRAWIGSRDYAVDQFDKVASAKRQPGSTFKPFVYAAALEMGYSPYYLAEDVVRVYTDSRSGKNWRPTNSGGGASGGILTLRQSLSRSKNTVSAHLIQRIGPRRVVDMASRMGIHSPMLAVPSLALGTSEVTLLELVSAYTTFTSDGIHRDPMVVTRIETADGRLIGQFGTEMTNAISSHTAYTMLDMMRDVVRPGGTGAIIRREFGLQGDLAGKTGTTQSNADGWFMLMHPDLVTGAWIGFNYPTVRMRGDYWGQGGHNALYVVGDFFRSATRSVSIGLSPLRRFEAPAGYHFPAPPVDPFAGGLVDADRIADIYNRVAWEHEGTGYRVRMEPVVQTLHPLFRNPDESESLDPPSPLRTGSAATPTPATGSAAWPARGSSAWPAAMQTVPTTAPAATFDRLKLQW